METFLNRDGDDDDDQAPLLPARPAFITARMQRALAVLALLAALASAGARPLSLDEIRALYPFQPVAPATRSFAALSNATTLRAAAAQRGIFVGTAINNGCLGNHSDPLYVSTFAKQYDLSTAENECKFAETEPAQGVFSLAACDAILGNSTATGAVMRLHNMVGARAFTPSRALGPEKDLFAAPALSSRGTFRSTELHTPSSPISLLRRCGAATTRTGC